MKKMKRLLPIYIIMVCCIAALSGCGSNYEGKDLVDRAKKLHTELEAAQILVSDRDTGEVAQQITYRFAGDVMQYMYVGHDLETGEEYYEFNSGNELDTWHTGDNGWSFVARGADGYYNYSRANRHYFADGEKLLDDHASAVKSTEVRNEASGLKIVSVLYDDSKIAQSEQMSGVTDYRQVYYIDDSTFGEEVSKSAGGHCYSMVVSYSKDGKEYSYAIDIELRDPDEPVERVGLPAVSGEITENAQ